ncbi:hypothetical protein PFISCL1PPCAC_14180, partial [Pristionchus fissidentatus]
MELARLATWCELAVSVLAIPLVLLLLYALLTSSLNRVCKVVLVMNGLGLLFLATSHCSVAVYRLITSGEWKARDIVTNVPLFTHQFAYMSCTVSLLLITIERMVIGLKPGLYVKKRVAPCAMVGICVIFEVVVALPIALLLQDGPTIGSDKLYRTSETSQKFAIGLVAMLDAIALMCCTATAFIDPILLLSRHRLLERRVRVLFRMDIREISPAIVRDPVTVSDVYFEGLKNGLN